MQPKPIQDRIPIWLGGRAEAVYRRVATIGDGWLASSTSTGEEFAAGWAKVKEHASALGREVATLMPAKFCYIHVDDDAEKAQAVLEEQLPRYYDFPYDVPKHALYGPPTKCADQAMSLIQAGVRTLIFATVADDRAQLELLAQEVIPEIRRSLTPSQ